jgi:hypothetical protein
VDSRCSKGTRYEDDLAADYFIVVNVLQDASNSESDKQSGKTMCNQFAILDFYFLDGGRRYALVVLLDLEENIEALSYLYIPTCGGTLRRGCCESDSRGLTLHSSTEMTQGTMKDDSRNEFS